MACTKAQKVQFSTHMLSEEAKDWWDNALQRLQVVGAEITWVVFITEFLENYFLTDIQSKKEIQFLELKERNMIVTEYAGKFKELVKFCQHYNNVAAEKSKCIQFERGLRPEINQGIQYQEIHRFPMLVNK